MLGRGTRKFYKKHRVQLSIGTDCDDYGVSNGVYLYVRERMKDAMQPRLLNS